MIALLLVAQLSAQPFSLPQAQAVAPPATPGLIRALPRRVACKGDPGRLEASLAQPAALYRQGDRPAKGLRRWADYPDGAVCAVEDAK